MTPPSELKNSLRPLSFFSKSLVVLLCCFLRSIAATWTAGRWGRTLWTPSPLDSLCGWCKRRAAQRVVCHDRAKKCFYIPEDREVIVYLPVIGKCRCQIAVPPATGFSRAMSMASWQARQRSRSSPIPSRRTFLRPRFSLPPPRSTSWELLRQFPLISGMLPANHCGGPRAF
jgi:hypothetical protein